MAYYGSTQLSSLANPPRQLIAPMAATPTTVGGTQTLTTQGASVNVPGGGGGGGGLWFYTSTNLTTDLTAASFFSDGFYIGMKAGDVVMGSQLSASAGSSVVSFIGTIISVSTAGASLSTGSLVTSTFN